MSLHLIRKVLTLICLVPAWVMADGLLHNSSTVSVRETANALERLIRERDLAVFLRLDHGQAGRELDFDLRDMELLIFGSPKLGSALIACAPTAGIDLPLKYLVWQDRDGVVWITWADLAALARKHDVTGCDAVLQKAGTVLQSIVTEAVRP